MIEGQSIERPQAEIARFQEWLRSVGDKIEGHDGYVFSVPNDIKAIFRTWLNAFDERPALAREQVQLTMLKGDHTALLNELNSRAEDYFDYLHLTDDYYVPADSSNSYKGLEYFIPTPILLYYNHTTKQWAITNDYSENYR